MGSGKSSYSKQISYALGMKCIDTDRLIEQMECMTIPEIFSAKGESYFREAERRVIEKLKEEDNIIVATGGGLPCFGDNMERLKEIGLTVYLRASVEELVMRLEKSHQKRPLIEGKSHDELTSFVSENLGRREKYYNLADIKYDANGRRADGLLAIVNFLKNK